MSNLAAILPSPKSPLAISILPIPAPGPTSLLIRNHLIAFNAIESKIAKLGKIPLDYPSILGSTFGGTITAVGSHVENFRPGDRVVVSKRFGVKGMQYGAYQQWVIVDDEMVSRVPEGVDFAVPASLMMNLTCVVGLFSGRLGLDRPSLQLTETTSVKDKKILVYGGSSSFGGLSVEYLTRAGYGIVTTASEKYREFVAKLGASKVLGHEVDRDALVEKLVSEGPYDVVVDMISLPGTVAVTARVLAAQGGGKLYTTQPAFGPESLPEGVERVFEPWSESLYEEENFGLREWLLDTYLPQGLLQEAITPLPIEKVKGGLRGINDALTMLHKGVSGKRLVADPWE
jgi:NADPH:quinone reductase-like Zn-dependent oxidoreductase